VHWRSNSSLEHFDPLQGLGTPLFRIGAILQIAVENAFGHESTEGAFGDQLRVGIQVFEPGQPTIFLVRVMITAHYVRDCFRREGIQQGRIMRDHEPPYLARTDNPLDVLQQGPDPTRMHTVIDLLDDDQRPLGDGQERGGYGENTQGPIR